MIRKYAKIFCWKNVSSFCSAKATHIFSTKNIGILYIESAKTVNEMTLNELVKLTTLWTTGPWYLLWLFWLCHSAQVNTVAEIIGKSDYINSAWAAFRSAKWSPMFWLLLLDLSTLWRTPTGAGIQGKAFVSGLHFWVLSWRWWG